MKSFLKQVANFLINNYENQLKDIAIVFPGKRSKLFLNKYLSEITNNTIWAPAYYTINELMEETSDLILADDVNLNLILFTIISSHFDKLSVTDNFFFQTSILLNDFDDIDKYLIDINALFSNISDLKEIETKFDYLTDKQKDIIKQFWNVVETKTSKEGKEKFLYFWNKLPEIYFQFNATLDSLSISYEGKIYRKVAEDIQKNNYPNFEYSLYIFAGFNALTPAEKVLFRHLKKNNKAIFLWDYDNYYLNEFHEAGHFIRENLKEFPSPDNWTDDNFNNINDANKEIYVISVPSKLSQANILPFIFEKIDTFNSSSPDKISIILPDESILTHLIKNLPEKIEEINISSGYPLSQTNWYSLLIDFFDTYKNKKQDNGTTFFYYKDVIKILQNPSWKLIKENEEAIKNLLTRIIQSNLIYIKEDLLEDIPLIKNFLILKNNVNTLRHLLEFFSEIYSKTNIDNNEFDRSLEYIALESIIHVLRRFLDITEKINFENDISLFKYFLFILKKQKINFSGEPLKGMQIMGLLESRTLDFENIIIFSMNEGIIPSSQKMSTFIPINLRYGYQLPVIDHHDSIYAYYFYRLLQRSKKIFLIYYNSTLSKNSEEKSRFIQQLEFEFPGNLIHINFTGKISVASEQNISVDKKNTKVNTKLQQLKNNTWILTPSAINTYIRCPLQFYYKYIEEIPEKKIITEIPEATDFGTAIHKVLKDIYTPFLNKTVSSKDLDDIPGATIENSIKKAIEEIYSTNDYKLEGYYHIAFEIMKRYVKAVINYDKHNSPFKLIALEEKVKRQISINENKITIGGTIDRIDIKNGYLRIIDYKTGRPENSINDLTDLFDGSKNNRKENVLQIFIYAYIYSKNNNSLPIYPSLFFIREIVNPEYNTNIRLYRSKNDNDTFVNIKQIENDLENNLKKVISEIIDENINFYQTINRNTCKFCQFNIICKRKI